MRLHPRYLAASCSLLLIPLASPSQAIDFVFAPAPVTGDLLETGGSSGNAKFTYLNLESSNTTITGLGGSLVGRNRVAKYFGVNFAANLLTMEDDSGDFTATTVNAMAGLDGYLSDNVIVFFDGSIGSTSTETSSSFSSSSSTIDVSGITYGIQLTLDAGNGVKFTPYYMAIEQTATTDFGPDIDISSSVIGLDILINNLSLAAMYQSTDDTDITMFSIGVSY